MKKNFVSLPLFGFTLFLFTIACGNTSIKEKKIWGVTRDFIGIQKGKTITFYANQGHNKWIQKPDKTFTVPDDMKSMFITENKIGVLTNKGLLMFYKNTAPKVWDIATTETFSISKDYSRVMQLDYNLFGFVKKDTIDFYTGRKAFPDLKFVAPTDHKDFFNAGGQGIVITHDMGLDFYSYFENKKWEAQSWAHFDYPSDMKELLPLMYYPGFGVVKEKSIDFYVFNKGMKDVQKTTTFVFPE